MDARRGPHLRLVEGLRVRGITDPRILEAFHGVARHAFVEEAFGDKAYEDCALPIGEKQSISQPSVVALMLSLLAAGPGDRVLEIGTGSGFQTALLARLASQVYSIERIASLARAAHARLRALGLANVHVKTFDGTYGWRDRGPFQGIIVTAAAPEVPSTLTEQLDTGGRLVLPVGGTDRQSLKRVVREGGGLRIEDHGPCHFVPLIGRFGWRDDALRGG